MHADVVARCFTSDADERLFEAAGHEVPDLVVVAAELDHDLPEAAAALQRELDLDGDPAAACVEDAVGEGGARVSVYLTGSSGRVVTIAA